MVNTEITKFTKLYVSNKNSNQKLYFAIDYEIRISKYNNEQTTTSIILYISYLYLEKDFCLRKAEARPNKWEFSSSSNNKSCSLHSSVMINIKSYGVGTFVLNEIIKIANEYTPNASLEGFCHQSMKEKIIYKEEIVYIEILDLILSPIDSILKKYQT